MYIQVNPSMRWQITHRLRQLNIDCLPMSKSNNAIWLDVITPTQGILVWSVVRHHRCSRLELADWLNHLLAAAPVDAQTL
ncbi:MAG: hypothetical protein SFT94_12640 [Pseudanabaenaceae cyanobacterium bins.68]|nr:hypothetical protein [Pseudanabaenaceae cyanobacterium bins.68]